MLHDARMRHSSNFDSNGAIQPQARVTMRLQQTSATKPLGFLRTTRIRLRKTDGLCLWDPDPPDIQV
jgi:hypothetical protein